MKTDVANHDEEYLQLETDSGPVKLAFCKDGSKVYLVSNDHRNRWPSSILRERHALIRIQGMSSGGNARLLSAMADKEMVSAKFTAKYGESYMKQYFSRPSRYIELDLDGQVNSGGQHYYSWLEAEFDSIAGDYDRHIYGNIVNRMLRDRSVELMKHVFKGRKRLLEIGCGTGTETLELLKEGYEITATDVSARMLEVLKNKARDAGLLEGLEMHKARAVDVGRIVASHSGSPFEGVYSNYGALNCEDDLKQVALQVHSVLKGDGVFVAGVYNRHCLWEILAYIATFQLDKARDRMRKFSMEGHSRFCVDIYSYTAKEFFSNFNDYFTLRSVQGVPVIIPPSNLSHYVEKFSSHLEALKHIDRKIGQRWPFNRLGDHFLMVMDHRA